MPVRRSTILVAAFAALLAISAGAARAIWKNTQDAQATASLLHRRDIAIHEALGDIRSSVYLTAILARDSLLEAAPNIADFKRQFAEVENTIQRSVRILQQQVRGQEMEALLNRLVAELDAYAQTTDRLLAESSSSAREKALRERGGRRRDILALAEEIKQLSVQSSAEQRMLSAAGDGSLRASLGWITGVALLLGGAVGGLTFARMRQLEEQSASAESELRSLSGQLRTTQEDERRHLSRELHDQVGQMLTGLRMELAVIGRNQSASAPDVQAAIERAKRNTEQTLSVVRNIAMLLRPSMLDDLGLTPALTWLAKEVEHSGGIEVHREIDPAVDQLPDPHRTCLFRVVQEALTNACRHSGARAVELRVTREAGLVHVRVTDQGVGFDPSAKRNKGLGLLGMEERVRELGGHLYVTSSPGRGVSIEVDLPEPADIRETETHANHESNDRRRPRDRADGLKAAL